jgi:hypothetical protein
MVIDGDGMEQDHVKIFQARAHKLARPQLYQYHLLNLLSRNVVTIHLIQMVMDGDMNMVGRV